jgi:Family of unknown function (DUF6424)
MADTHLEHEDFPWIIAVADHAKRTDSNAYRESRALMHEIVKTTRDWILAGDSYQDHHGGSVWVKDAQGWLCVQLPLGIEWSAQFCADPAKVDQLRQYAARIVAAFPDTLPGYLALGYMDGQRLLTTPVKDAAGVSAWTDSIFNASMPLPVGTHTGVLPTAAGYHHYPKPIVDIDHFRYADFELFVTDATGLPAAVVPVAPRGSGDGRVRLIAAHPDSAYIHRLASPTSPPREQTGPQAAGLGVAQRTLPTGWVQQAGGEPPDILSADDTLARQAFVKQHGRGGR